MNLYEHTIIARQDASPAELKQLTEKYSKIIEKNDGEIVKTENWGLLNLSYLIKKNRKGSFIHFKIKGDGKVIEQLEKNEAIDKKLLRNLTVRVKKFDLENNYFPHISLSYGNHEIKEKKILNSKLPIISKQIKISKIALVEVDEDINLWKILENFDLN